jgi:hypothetical protein
VKKASVLLRFVGVKACGVGTVLVVSHAPGHQGRSRVDRVRAGGNVEARLVGIEEGSLGDTCCLLSLCLVALIAEQILGAGTDRGQVYDDYQLWARTQRQSQSGDMFMLTHH